MIRTTRNGAPERRAHAILVDRILDERDGWGRIEERLQKYPAIGTYLPIEMLREYHGRPPHRVHWLAWRLATWKSEENFEVFDALLRVAAALPGWEKEAQLLTSTDCGTYWSLLWQMQVAALLVGRGADVRWLGAGAPDLRVAHQREEFFVECFSYQKRFAVACKTGSRTC